MSRVLVIYYSAYGHVFEMAQAAAEGAKAAPDERELVMSGRFGKRVAALRQHFKQAAF